MKNTILKERWINNLDTKRFKFILFTEVKIEFFIENVFIL